MGAPAGLLEAGDRVLAGEDHLDDTQVGGVVVADRRGEVLAGDEGQGLNPDKMVGGNTEIGRFAFGQRRRALGHPAQLEPGRQA